MNRKWCSWLLVLAMLISTLPFSVAATQETEGCEHHTSHTEECGYQEITDEVPCSHVCGQDCEQQQIRCTHPEHTPECYALEEDGVSPTQDPVNCTHTECTAESGCVTVTAQCIHSEHDELCGYAAAAEGQACQYICELCPQPEEEEAQDTLKSEDTPALAVQTDSSFHPVEVYFAPDPLVLRPNDGLTVQVKTSGTGSAQSILYEFINDSTGEVALSHQPETPEFQYLFRPTECGTYSCKVTLTNDQGQVFTVTTEESLVVDNYVHITALYLSREKLSLMESFNVTAETAGEGSCSFLYEVYQNQDEGFVSIYETTSESPEFTYTPEASGTYYVAVTSTSGEYTSHWSTENITVHSGLWLKKLHLAGRDGSHCILQAVTEGDGCIQSLVFQVVDIETGEPVGDPQDGSSSIFHFPIPENAKDTYRCQATLTDEEGNVTVGEVDFEVFSNRLRILHILQSRDSHDYPPGETITFTVETVGEGTIANLRYEIYDSSSNPYRLVTAHDNTTDTTYSYLPEQCGEYYVEVILTDAEGNTDTAYTGFTVTDTSFAFTGLTVTPATVAPGETVSFSCQVTDPDRIANISCSVGGFDIYQGTDLTWSYTPQSYLSFWPIPATVEITTTDGSVYTQYATIDITDADKCLLNYARATKRFVTLGNPVTIDVSLGGSQKFQSLTYRIINEEDGSEEVFVSTESQLTYIPKKIGTHTVALSMTHTNGNITNYDSTTLEFLVTTVYPEISPNQTLIELGLGENVTFQIPLVGDGTVEYVRYTIRGHQWDGTPIEPVVYEGTEISYTFHPEVAGSYSASAILINSDGFTFYPRLPQLIVYDGIYLTGLTASSETLSLGESVIFTPAYQGNGEIEELYYYITWYGLSPEDQPLSARIPASLEPFTWTPEKEGNYTIELNLYSEIGYWTSAQTSIVVEKSNILRPTQQPEGSSADLTKMESGSLDAEAAAWAEEGTQAEISLSTSYVQPQTDDPEQALLKEALGDKNYELLDISVTKTENGETTQLTETKTVLELKIPFRYQGKTEVSINRIHNGVCHTLWRLPSRPSSPVDGTFYADVENNLLYIYSSQYCLFSISYKTTSTDTTPQPPAPAAAAAIEWTLASDNPPTGDTIWFPILAMFSTGALLLFLFLRRKYVL